MGLFESSYDQSNIGKVIYINNNSYTIDSILGKGGFATVYGATLDSDGNNSQQQVAIKETRLREMPALKMRYNALMYLNEISILKQLQRTNHDNVVCILDYDFNPQLGNAYLVEERGIPFEEIIGKKSQIIKEPKRASYFCGMVKAVAVLHKLQIVHADLKPANFIVVDFKIKLIDLGTSFFLPNHKVYTDRQAIGTPGYMAPEQRGIRGRAIYGFKCDIYSLGAILYEMTFGRRIPCPPNNKPIPVHSNPYLYDILVLCLQPSPTMRPDIHQVLLHPYMTYN